MRRIVVLLLILVIPMLSAQDPGAGSIEGTVINSVTNQPVAGVRVRTGPTGGSPYPASEYSAIDPIVTGADGKFAFRGLKAAVYRILIEGNGYTRQFYGQNTFPGEGTRIVLIPSQVVKGITVRLNPTGTVSGRIRDRDTQQPVPSVPVQLMRLEYRADGERSLVAQPGAARTNDRGEYRLYFITPGRYFLNAGGVLPTTSGTRGLNNSNEIPANYASVFYPGVAKREDATPVDVKPGADIGGIDLLVGKHVLYQIRGRVLDSKTGQPPTSATIALFRRSDTRWERVQASNNYNNGAFSISGLVSGSYRVVVQASSARRMAQSISPLAAMARVTTAAVQAVVSRAQDPTGYAAKVIPVEIVSSDVSDLVVSVAPGVSVNGRLTIEGQPLAAADSSRLGVFITSTDRLISANALAPQGLFRLTDIAPGQYRAGVGALPAGYYVKSATFGGTDALQNGFQVLEDEVNGLNVVISSSVAVVDGTARNERQEVVADSLVVLVPERNRDRTDLFQQVTSGQDGRFTFRSVPPGSYKIFAWEALEPYAYFDPEVLRQVEQKGRALQLGESTKQSVDVGVIPATN
jgi:hypothetical protein